MRKITLTPKQQETLTFIKDFVSQHGNSPTIKEIQSSFNLNSLRSVSQRLEALERKGLIKRDSFKHRNIVVLDSNMPMGTGVVQIPVILSAGCDAQQVYAQEAYDEYLFVDKQLTDMKKEIVAIKAIGNSMIDAGIHNGDYVLVEVTDNVQNGDRVVAVVGEMAVIKRLKKVSGSTILEPESEGNGYSPIVLTDNSKIFGRVLSVIPYSSGSNDNIQFIYEPGFKPKL